MKSLSRVRLFVTPWTAAYQALPSMGFSRHEYWSGVPLLSPRTQPLGFLGVQWAHLLRCAVCLFWGADLWLRPCQHMSTVQSLQVGGAFYHLPHPSRSVFWVYNGCAFSGVPCVSSGKLISGCDPPGGCQPFRIPISLGYQQSLLAVWHRMPLWGLECPLPALAALACLSGGGWASPQPASSAQSFAL